MQDVLEEADSTERQCQLCGLLSQLQLQPIFGAICRSTFGQPEKTTVPRPNWDIGQGLQTGTAYFRTLQDIVCVDYKRHIFFSFWLTRNTNVEDGYWQLRRLKAKLVLYQERCLNYRNLVGI